MERGEQFPAILPPPKVLEEERRPFVAVGRLTTKVYHANEVPCCGLSRAASRRVRQRSALCMCSAARLKSIDREERVSVYYRCLLEDARHYQAGHQGV